ncbi:hypothetical protein CG708_25540, partial [Salmonella enterica subsp. enterica serovar Typhimurium]
MKQLTILGSTGSIGCSTLDVVRHNPDSFRVLALVAGPPVALLAAPCLACSPLSSLLSSPSLSSPPPLLLPPPFPPPPFF